MKNIRMMVILLATFLLAFMDTNNVYAMQTLPEAIDGQILLYDDVTLSETFIVTEEDNLTINLNGHTITGPTDGYAIENKGILTITNSSKNGKIISNYNGYNIYNGGQLKLKNVTIENSYKSVIMAKAKDENAKITIEDSKIIAGSEKNTFSIGSKRPTNSAWKTIINIYNSEIDGKISYSYNEIHVNGTIKLNDRAIGITERLLVDNKTQIILTSDATNVQVKVPDGATLIIPEGVTFTQTDKYQLKGDIIINGILAGSKYYNETMKSYHTIYSKVKTYSSKEKNDKIKLIDDVEEKSNIDVGRDRILLLDLNGHSISTTKQIQSSTDANLMIVDTSKEKTGKINANVKIVGSNANITIKGGTINGLIEIYNEDGAAMIIEDTIINGSIKNKKNLTIKNGTFSQIPVTEEGGVTTLLGGTYPLGELTGATIPDEVTIIKGNETQIIKSKSEPADYTKLDQLIKKVNDIDLTKYTDETVKHLTDIIDGIDHKLTILAQAKVDKYVLDVEEAIKKLVIKPGEIIVSVKKESEENFAKINNSSVEIEKLFTQEELLKIKNGQSGEIYLQVEDIDNQLSEVEKNLIHETGKATGYKYFDFSLLKKIGTLEAVKITDCNLPISITVKVPTDLINTSNNIVRTYYIVRLHDGKAERIDGIFDQEKNEFTFKTDKFSLYALAYTDIQKEGEISNTEETKQNEDINNPNTYDKLVLHASIIIVSFVGVIACTLYIKQKEFKK